jgi:anti-anti-sigma factor
MPIERWSDKIAVVHLADDPQFSDELGALEQAIQHGKLDVVVDFAAVHFVNSSNIARLLRLRKQMIQHDCRLILCGISTQVWGTFLITGLDKVFDFSDNVPTGLATLQMKSI